MLGRGWHAHYAHHVDRRQQCGNVVGGHQLVVYNDAEYEWTRHTFDAQARRRHSIMICREDDLLHLVAVNVLTKL